MPRLIDQINVPDPLDPDGQPIKVAFGSFLRLYDEDSLIKAMNVPGLSKRGFRRLLRTLHVPVLEISNTRLVDGFSFFLAMRAILRIGAPDFLTPSCKTRQRDPGKKFPGTRTSIPVEEITDNWKVLACEIMLSQRTNRMRVSDKVLGEMASLATQRILALGIHHAPLRAQRIATEPTLQSLRVKEVIPPWIHDDAYPTTPIFGIPLDPDLDPGPPCNQ